MWVVKLGGSLAHSPDLNSWLDVFSDPSGIKVVIVPGGGSYADEVRRSQKISGFDDDTAHRMAILAMDKFGLWLCEKTKHFIPAKSAAEIEEALNQHRMPIWIPSAMTLTDTSIPASWDVTSDSLAAWLATLLSADALILVKSAQVNFSSIDRNTLSGLGIVDKAFPQFANCDRYQARVLHASQHELMREALRSGEPAGVQVVN